MKKVYGIVGAGNAPAKAIMAALNDLEKDAVFYVAAHSSDSMDLVYDWLIDNEKDFILYGNPSKILRQKASDVIETNDDADKNLIVLKYLSAGDTLLVLWEDGLDDVIFKAHQKGYTLLELTNGLAPISVEDDEPVEKPISDDDEEDYILSREELESMPVAAVKRYAVNYGMDIKGLSKDDIIDALFGEAQVKTTEVIEYPTSEASVATIVVVFKSGASVTISADAAMMQKLFASIL